MDPNRGNSTVNNSLLSRSIQLKTKIELSPADEVFANLKQKLQRTEFYVLYNFGKIILLMDWHVIPNRKLIVHRQPKYVSLV